MFSTFDCAVKGYRQKEDAWNAIISGFMTGGCLAARSESFFLTDSRMFSANVLSVHALALTLILFFILGGPKAAFGSAVACGILLGVFEGVGVLLGRVFSEGTRPQLPPCELPSQLFLSSTHLSALASTGVDVSTDTIGCYLIRCIHSLPHPLSSSRNALCRISRSFPLLGHWRTCFDLDYLCNSPLSLSSLST